MPAVCLLKGCPPVRRIGEAYPTVGLEREYLDDVPMIIQMGPIIHVYRVCGLGGWLDERLFLNLAWTTTIVGGNILLSFKVGIVTPKVGR